MTEKKYLDFPGLQEYDRRIKSEIESAVIGDIGLVTTTTNGLMSAEDKVKLNGITADADNVSYTAEVSSGTKLGTITINGTDNDIYAPSISGKADADTAVTHTASTAVGSTTQGIYVASDGTATAMTYELNKTVPADAVFTDTTYTAATAAPGNVASSSAVGTSTNYARQDHTHGITVGTGDANGQIKIAGTNASVKGLGSAAYTASTDYIAAAEKGANNGVAELDSSGKVPSSQLPSFVDDVIEGYLYSGKFYKESAHTTEITAESGKIYTDLATDTTYRWSGTAYTQIKGDLALGETSTTAYRGDRGKIAYDHSQSTHARTDATKTEASSTNGNIKINGTETTVYTHPGSGTNPHGTTKSDVGLGNVGNFKAVSTVASQGLTDTEKVNARANIGAGISSFSGSYNDLTNKPTIPTVNNATLTIQKNGTNVKTFTANASSDVTANITVPTKVSELTNDSGFTTNTGTITGITMNGASKGTSGVVDLGTVITAHQDISGKANTADLGDGAYKNSGVYYGTCATAAATKDKVVSVSSDQNFTLKVGAVVHVKFTNTNTYSATADNKITLNVNSTGAKNIYYSTGYPTGTNTTAFGSANWYMSYMYNGTDWVWVGLSGENNTTYSAMSSSELTTGTATTSRTVRADYLKTGINSLIDTKISALDVTGASGIAASKTISAWSETDGKVSISTQDISITKSQVSDFPTSMTPTSHTHGNIQNGGTLQTNDITITSGDKLVVTDSSDSNKIARTSISFDGSTATKALTQKGTWESFTNNAGTITGITMNGASKGTSGVVDLGTVITAHQDISGKADKSATVSTVAWDSTNKKITKTINGTTSDVVTAATILGNLTKAQVTTALGYTPPTTDTNTTYTFATGDSNGQIKVTPSGGTAQNISVKGLGTAAYKAETNFAVSKELTNEDLNSVTEPGFYNAGGSNTCANKPSGVGAFGLEVVHTAAGSYYYQILNPNGSTSFYRRICNNGTWSNWAQDKYTDTNNYVTQSNTTSGNWRKVTLSYQDAAAGTATTTNTQQVYVTPNVEVQPSTGAIRFKKYNSAISGSGTAAEDKGSGVSPRYFPAKWTFNTGAAPSDGDTITIKIPVAGHDYGVFLSVNNGTNYHPVVCSNAGRLTTHFSSGRRIQLIFESDGSADSMYALNGSDTRATVTGGAWRVLNYYDANNSTRQLPTTTNANYEVLFSGTADNTDRTETTRKDIGLKFNPSTRALTIHREGTTTNNYGTFLYLSNKDTTTGQTYSNSYIAAYNDHQSTTYGNNLVIHTGGGLFIGSGESPANHYTAKGASYSGEDTFLTSDGVVNLQANGNTIANRVGFQITTDGALVPAKADAATNNIGSIGTNTYKIANGYFTNINGVAVETSPKFTDTLNTAGSTDTSSKIFLIGATSQAANPQTYSHDTAYVGTDGCLYSGGTKVLTAHQDISGKADKSATVSTVTWDSTNKKLTKTINGSTTDIVTGATILDGLTKAQVTTALGYTPPTSDTNNRKAFYATCTTAAATKDKVATLAESAGWPGLVAGIIVGVKFTNTNSYSNATASPITLNVNSTGAKNIYYAGTHSGAGNTGTNTTAYGRANYINYYMYDGTYWVWLSSSSDNNTDIRPSAYCDTAAGTAEKVASCTGFTLTANRHIHVIIVNANSSASAITLNINSKGAKPIYINGTASSASNYTLPAGSYLVYYNGTNFYFRTDGKLTMAGMVDTSNNNLNTWRGVQNNLTSTATDQSLSAAQGKILNEKITNWTATQTLAEGTTSVTFTGLTSTYAYDLYSETADGTPVYTTGYTVSGTSITYTLQAITSGQAGTGGTGCKVKLKCLY